MPLTPAQVGAIAKVNTLAQEARTGLRATLDSAYQAGEILLKLKVSVRHGEWAEFIRENFTINDRTARAWMQLASNRQTADLLQFSTISDALKAIIEPKVAQVASSSQEGHRPVTPETAGSNPVATATDAPTSTDTPPDAPTEPYPSFLVAIKDETGRNISVDAKFWPTIRVAFERRDEITALMTQISALKTAVARAAREDPLYCYIDASRWEMDCDTLRAALRFARPYAVCPYCDGNGKPGPKGCEACRNQGWVGATTWKHSPAAYDLAVKEIVEAAP